MASLDPQFLSTFLRQNFDLPDSMIYYILKNPKSSKAYQKLIQTCKYFFVKNPILVFHCLHIDDDAWKICSNQRNCSEAFQKSIDARIFSSCCKLWINYQIRVFSTNSTAALDLIPKIYHQCASKVIFFKNQKLSLQQFLFYAQNSEGCRLENCIFNSDVCAEIPLEEIIGNLPNVLTMFFVYGPTSKNASSNTAKKLLQIPHFKNITKLRVLNASEKFDIDPIYDYYKNNRSRFTFGVHYQNGLPEVMAKKIDGIAQEILDFKFHQNETPLLGYPVQVDNSALKNLYRSLWKLHKESLLYIPY